MNNNFYEKLVKVLEKERILVGEPMKDHTTFRLGGPADYFLIPKREEEVRRLLMLCREEGAPCYVIGNGSNLLVSDKGYRGAIIQIYTAMGEVCTKGEIITARSGAPLSKIADEALENGLTGFEFASGIPGTLGGACIMNAGAYGGEMKDVLLETTVLTQEGEIIKLDREKMGFGYRTSVMSRKGYIILGARIKLEQGEREKIRRRMEELKKRREEKQPLEYPSAGSTFKRPEGHFAGSLIESAGLRGFRIGGAQVSEKHCGFVINTGNATAAEVNELIKQVSDRVFAAKGVRLEPEVKRLGEF